MERLVLVLVLHLSAKTELLVFCGEAGRPDDARAMRRT